MSRIFIVEFFITTAGNTKAVLSLSMVQCFGTKRNIVNTMQDTKLIKYLIFTLLLMIALAGCRRPAPAKVNDGYGDYMLVPEGTFSMGDNFGDAVSGAEGCVG